MHSGKRSVAEGIVYGSLGIIKERTGDDPIKARGSDSPEPA